jgi:hypothetical protein
MVKVIVSSKCVIGASKRGIGNVNTRLVVYVPNMGAQTAALGRGAVF